MSFSYLFIQQIVLSTYNGPGSKDMAENKKNTIICSHKTDYGGKDAKPFLNIRIICERNVILQPNALALDLISISHDESQLLLIFLRAL